MDDITRLVVTIFSRVQKVPLDRVDLDADLFSDYGVDSLRAVKLLSTLEVELEIELPDEEIQAVRTLRDVAVLARRIQAEPVTAVGG